VIRPGLDAHVVGRRKTGNETYIVNLAEALARREDVGPVIYLNNGAVWPTGDPPGEVRRLKLGVPQLRIPIELPFRAARDGVDLLHVQYVAPPFASVPIVTAVHDIVFEDFPNVFPRRTMFRLKATVRWSVRRSAAVLAPSAFTRQRIIEHYRVDPARVVVAPGGVSAIWRPMPEQWAQEILAPLGLPARFVLHVGNLHPRKNIPRLIHAVAAARREVDPDLGLVLAGQPWWRTDEVDRAIHEVKGVAWLSRLGYVDTQTLLALYNAAHVVAYPSLYEGYGLPAVEALACGAVLVASSTTSIPEVTGDAAVLVDPSDVNALAAGVARATSDDALRTRLRVAGVGRAAATTWDLSATRTLEAYRIALD
jgi:glycosyltransferase involved in cell wall biosynthesis